MDQKYYCSNYYDASVNKYGVINYWCYDASVIN